ncbi:TPA: hypothetical protein N0F65_011087 [Lagenidium giganteum]|uniref:Uncharacterized protein n=1 Tax=Lagenidium giganteum TaxID=4803 RepID=A0AAV2ZFD2_9STRA|nr:TPA: hypothetical protein N0F65_011087 [Lagenidium giganteum]
MQFIDESCREELPFNSEVANDAMGQPSSTSRPPAHGGSGHGASASHGHAGPGTAPTRRLDLRWSRLTLDQLDDEDFLLKQHRRLENVAGARYVHQAEAGHSAGQQRNFGLFLQTTRAAMQQQRHWRLGQEPLGAAQGLEDQDAEVAAGNVNGSGASPEAMEEKKRQRKEQELFNALYVLGDLAHPELAAVMYFKLKEALVASLTSDTEPYHALLRLRSHILQNMLDATLMQQQQWRNLEQRLASHMDALAKTPPPAVALSTAAAKRRNSLSSGATMDAAAASASMTSFVASKPKDKVVREACVAVQAVLTLLDGLLDSMTGTETQRHEFLNVLVPLVQGLPALSLAPRAGMTSPSTSGGNAVPAPAISNAPPEAIALLDRLQAFLLELCPAMSTERINPTSPKLVIYNSSPPEGNMQCRSSAINCLIHLAAARASVSDFLLAVRVLLGASESDNGREMSPLAVAASLTSSMPLLKTTKNADIAGGDDPDQNAFDDTTPRPRDINSVLDKGIKSARLRTESTTMPSKVDLDTVTPSQELLHQVKRKGLPKSFIPKTMGTNSITVNLAHRGTNAHPNISIPPNKNRTKEEYKEILLNGSLTLSLDLSMHESSREHTLITSRGDQPFLTARCPKFQSLNIETVLRDLDLVKAADPTKASLTKISHPSATADAGVLPGDEESEDREVWSCGQNSYGELGHGDTTTRKSFERIEALQRKDIVQVCAGNEHTIALGGDGVVYTCGYNDNGQCGQGVTTRIPHMTEVQKLGESPIAQVHAYNGCEHTVLITQEGRAASCGYNYRGQLGHGNTTSESFPKMMRSLEGKVVRLVSCSYYHTILTCESGGREFVYTFGRNDYGQLGQNDAIDRKVPQLVEAMNDHQIASVACGQYHTMLVTSSGKVFGFGKNDYGQLGVESVENQLLPVQVKSGLERQVGMEVRCGYYHTIVLCGGAHLFGFGRNDYGQLGLGRSTATAAANMQLQQQRFSLPQLIEELDGKEVVRFACGCYHTVVVCESGLIYVFGRNNHGQLGTGDTNERLYPFPIDDFLGKRVAMVAAGFYHTIVLTGGKEEEKPDQSVENELGDDSKADSANEKINHLLILSNPLVRQYLEGPATTSPKTQSRRRDKSETDAITASDPTFDADNRDEDDNIKNSLKKSRILDSIDAVSSSAPFESLEIAGIILAQLDRLCKPFLPKRGSYPHLQNPMPKAMDAILGTDKFMLQRGLNLSDLFDGTFELCAIHVCSSTFESLNCLLRHLCSRKIETTTQLQLLNCQSRSQTARSPRADGDSANAIQAYMVFACLRLTQANLSQLLRSGLAKAALMLGRPQDVSNCSYASEVNRIRLSLNQIATTLVGFIDMNPRKLGYIFDSGAETTMASKVVAEAIDTLMLGLEIFYPCPSHLLDMVQHAMGSADLKHQPNATESCRCAVTGFVPFPKSKSALLSPLLRRLAEDSLLVKLLPSSVSIPLSQETITKLGVLRGLYTSLIDRVAADSIRAIGSRGSAQTASALDVGASSSRPLLELLKALQKQFAGWATGTSAWEVPFNWDSSTPLIDRLPFLIRRNYCVDDRDRTHMPLAWHVLIEYAQAVISSSCEFLLQVIVQEPAPSPTRYSRMNHNPTHGSQEHDSLDAAITQSIVCSLLPSLVSCIMAFKKNATIAAALLPDIRILLRMLDELNSKRRTQSSNTDLELVAKKANSAKITGSSRSFGVSDKGGGKRSDSFRRNPPAFAAVLTLPATMLLEKDVAVLATEMAITLTEGMPQFDMGGNVNREIMTTMLARWQTSSIFSGGLQLSLLTDSLKSTKGSIRMNGAVAHSVFDCAVHGIEGLGLGQSERIALSLPQRYVDMTLDLGQSWAFADSKLQHYSAAFGTNALAEFTAKLVSVPPVRSDPTSEAHWLCDRIRQQYTKTNPTYRMLIRHDHTEEIAMENAVFGVLLHHNVYVLSARHFAHYRSAKSMPTGFLWLWRVVAEFRRRLSGKKATVKKMAELEESKDEISTGFFRANLLPTIIDRCQLLTRLDVREVSEHQLHWNDNGFPDACNAGGYISRVSVSGLRSLRSHARTRYTKAKLPFLVAFPKSRWKQVRSALHTMARWKNLCRRNVKETLSLLEHEILDFLLDDAPVTSPDFLCALLVEPCRRVSSATKGFEILWEVTSSVSLDAILTDALWHVVQAFVLQQNTSVVQDTNAPVALLQQRDNALVDFLMHIVSSILDKIQAPDPNSKLVSLLLACWAMPFEVSLFDVVNGAEVLPLIRKLMQVCAPPRAVPECRDVSGLLSYEKDVQSDRSQLLQFLWLLFRFICVQFAPQVWDCSRQQALVSTDPSLSPSFDLLFEMYSDLVRAYFSSSRLPSLDAGDRPSVALAGTLRRSFEIIVSPRRFSTLSKGLTFSYEEMTAPTSPEVIPMSPLAKANEFSITAWFMISTATGSTDPAQDPGKLERRLVCLRGSEREILPYVLLLPENDATFIEVGLIVATMDDASSSSAAPHLVWERMVSKEPIPHGKWTHVSIVLEAAKLRLYINGVLDCQRAIAAAQITTFSAAQITTFSAAPVDLPFHFGRAPLASTQRASVDSAIRLLSAITSGTKHASSFLTRQNSTGLSVLKSFEGSLCHFRFHNRALSPIHVRIVFDEKTPLLDHANPVPVSTQLSLNTRADEGRLMDLNALLMLLTASSEGIIHFVNNSRWLHVMWTTILESASFQLQQSCLRVFTKLLSIQSPDVASAVILESVHPDTAELLGMQISKLAFLQQLFRIVGFAVSYCSSTEDAAADCPAEPLPPSLMLPVNIHGNYFSSPTATGMNESQHGHASSGLASELILMLQTLFEDRYETGWLRCILEVMKNACAEYAIAINATIFKIGKRQVSTATFREMEVSGCLHFMSGMVNFANPGSPAEFLHTSDMANFIHMEKFPTVNSRTGKSSESTIAFVVLDRPRQQPQSTHCRNAYGSWYKQVARAHAVCSGTDQTDEKRAIDRFLRINIKELAPVTSSSRWFRNPWRVVLPQQQDACVDIALKGFCLAYCSSEEQVNPTCSNHGASFLNKLQWKRSAMASLADSVVERTAALTLALVPRVLEAVIEMAIHSDHNGPYRVVMDAEVRSSILHQRLYHVLVELDDEAEGELNTLVSATMSLCVMDKPTTEEPAAPASVGVPITVNPASDTGSSKVVVTQIGMTQAGSARFDLGLRLDMSEPEGGGSDVNGTYRVRTQRVGNGDDDDDEEEEDDDDEDEDGEEEDEEEDDEDEEDGNENRAEFVDELMLMGFPEEWCIMALKQTENDIVSASAWIVDNLEYLSKLQSSLDKRRDQSEVVGFNEEEDDAEEDDDAAATNESNSIGLTTAQALVRPQSCPASEFASVHQDAKANEEPRELIRVSSIINDKEMARKVFGEMYFPFEEGGYRSNGRSLFAVNWRSHDPEALAASASKGLFDEEKAQDSATVSTIQYRREVEEMEMQVLVDRFIECEKCLTRMYARQVVGLVCWHAIHTNDANNVTQIFRGNYLSFFTLLKLVLFRGVDNPLMMRGGLCVTTMESMMSSVVKSLLRLEFDGFGAALIRFCCGALDAAASSKKYEAILWTQRDLQRSDVIALEEPAIELAAWLFDQFFSCCKGDENAVLLTQLVTELLLCLRRCFTATNLPLKLLAMHAASRILSLLPSAEVRVGVIKDACIVFDDVLNAAKHRYSRELVQNRLLFSTYLQGYIEFLLVLLRSEPKLLTADRVSAPHTIPSFGSSTDCRGAFGFDRKKCRSTLVSISDDGLSATFSGNEVWKTVLGTEALSTGLHSWQIRVDKSTSSYLFIGIASRRANVDSFLGADEHSWGFIGDKALYYQRNRVKAYGEAFAEGDTVGVRLDCERGMLSFSKNGVDLGVAFENVVGEVFPAVAFYSRHQKVTLVKDGWDFQHMTAFGSDGRSTESGGVEECLLTCEMMHCMLTRSHVRDSLMEQAYSMTTEWNNGVKKFVTTRTGSPLWVDVSPAVCSPLGFRAGERVRTSRGNGTVVGVADGRIWVEVDGEQGAWFVAPGKLRSLTLISVSNIADAAKEDRSLLSSKSDSRVDAVLSEASTPASSAPSRNAWGIASLEEFVFLVEDCMWTEALDGVLLKTINAHCESASTSPWNLSPIDLMTLLRKKEQDHSELSALLRTSNGVEQKIIARVGFLRFFNACLSRVVAFFDMSWYYFAQWSGFLPCELVSKCRGRIFVTIKNELFTSLMEKTANAPKKADDDYDYPEDLPQVMINRPKAASARCHDCDIKSLFHSIFGQAFEELHFLPLRTLRMVYSHPMDDGQLRSFKVKFEGEGVDDYGGPYREFFSQFFAELQMLKSEAGSSTLLDADSRPRHAEEEDGSNPTECFLPFLLPCPNWRNGVGENREKFVLNAALLAENRIAQSAELQSVEEKRQLHGEMFYFLGQMLGICVRTRVCVRLDLAMSVWKQLVGEQSTTDAEDALHALKEIDFVAFTLLRRLETILREYESLGQHHSAHKADLEEELAAMDLSFITHLSDGRMVELCENGSGRVVAMENLHEYLALVIEARKTECADVVNIIKQGLNSIVPVSSISLLTWDELEKRVCGVAEVDVELLKQNTEYDEDVSADDEFVQRFWRVLSEMVEEDKRAFLRFVWARSRLPVGSSNFHQKFKIQSLGAPTTATGNEGNPAANPGGAASAPATGTVMTSSTTPANAATTPPAGKGYTDTQLPKSHTCFFALQLPRYSTDAICRKQVLYAIHNCVEMDGDFRLADTEMTGWNDINPNDQLRF